MFSSFRAANLSCKYCTAILIPSGGLITTGKLSLAFSPLFHSPLGTRATGPAYYKLPLALNSGKQPGRRAGWSGAVLLSRSMSASPANENKSGSPLPAKEIQLLRLFMSICCHQWEHVVNLGSSCLESGVSITELLGCIRHVVVTSGYPPALAAAKKLHAAGLIKGGAPGKAGGQPGNAFDLVYAGKTDKVWENLYAVEPVLSEWIRCHCYGDVYSSPGLDLRQKQLLTSAFLAEAEMHDEFFGHVIAGIRFGSTQADVLQAVDIAFEIAGSRDKKQDAYRHTTKLVQKAAYKVAKDFPNGVPPLPAVTNNDPESVCQPAAPPPLQCIYYEE